MIVLAFIAGAQRNPAFGMMSFLCFFVLGVVLIIEGRKRSKEK